jgi:hypothetical protein
MPNGADQNTLLNLCGAINHPTRSTVDVLASGWGRWGSGPLDGPADPAATADDCPGP